MQKIFIAFVVTMLVGVASLSQATEHRPRYNQPVYNGERDSSLEFSYPTAREVPRDRHMFRLSNEAKENSESWWEKVEDFFGGHNSCER